MSIDGICEVKRCKHGGFIIYGKRRRDICKKHWDLHCERTINLKKKSTFKGNPAKKK